MWCVHSSESSIDLVGKNRAAAHTLPDPACPGWEGKRRRRWSAALSNRFPRRSIQALEAQLTEAAKGAECQKE